MKSRDSILKSTYCLIEIWPVCCCYYCCCWPLFGQQCPAVYSRLIGLSDRKNEGLVNNRYINRNDTLAYLCQLDRLASSGFDYLLTLDSNLPVRLEWLISNTMAKWIFEIFIDLLLSIVIWFIEITWTYCSHWWKICSIRCRWRGNRLRIYWIWNLLLCLK